MPKGDVGPEVGFEVAADWRFASERSGRAYCIEQSNSAAILLGSHHLFLRVTRAG